MHKFARIAMWTVAILLGAVFLYAGFSKMIGPGALRWGQRLAHWGYPAGFRYVIGAIEVLAALGLWIPRVRRWAAMALITVMVGAMGTHLVHAEFQRLVPPFVLAALAVLVIVGSKLERTTLRDRP